MRSRLSPDHPGTPSFSAAGLARGPYILTIETDSAVASVAWSVTDCPRLQLLVTVTVATGLLVDRTCVQPPAGPTMVR